MFKVYMQPYVYDRYTPSTIPKNLMPCQEPKYRKYTKLKSYVIDKGFISLLIILKRIKLGGGGEKRLKNRYIYI